MHQASHTPPSGALGATADVTDIARWLDDRSRTQWAERHGHAPLMRSYAARLISASQTDMAADFVRLADLLEACHGWMTAAADPAARAELTAAGQQLLQRLKDEILALQQRTAALCSERDAKASA